MRKAAGTSIVNFFNDNRGDGAIYGYVQPMEWGLFPVSCFR